MCDLLSYFWPDKSSSLLIRGLYIVYYGATIVVAYYTWEQYLRRAYRTHWFDVSTEGWLKKLSWKPDVRYLMTRDPLEHTPEWRAGLPFQTPRDFLALVLSLSVWFVGLLGLGALGKNPSKDNIEVATFLIGFLSLAVAATKVTYEWRLKARSENRQKWIDEIRGTLSLLIENIPGMSDDGAARDEKAKVYFKEHGKMELLMNPSEKDHRALMALIRHLYGHDGVPIDDIPRRELGIAAPLLSNPAGQIALKSQMIRLSNVVLKREWERVKRIQ
jgi:hypothetical protein